MREVDLWRKYHGHPGCTEIEGGGCARSIMETEPASLQKERLEEEIINALGHEVPNLPSKVPL